MNKKLIFMSLTVLTQLVAGERSSASNDLVVNLISSSWNCSQNSLDEIIRIIEDPQFDPNIPGGTTPFRQYPLDAALDGFLDQTDPGLLDNARRKRTSSDYCRIICKLIRLPQIDPNLTTGDQPPLFKVVEVIRKDKAIGQEMLNIFLNKSHIDILAKGLHNSVFKRPADLTVALELQGESIKQLRKKTKKQLAVRRGALSKYLPEELVDLITEEFL